jgi:hypothetical protein
MHVGNAHGHDEEPIFFRKPSAFDCGMDVLCGGGAWGSSQLEDHSKPMNQQCAFVLIK